MKLFLIVVFALIALISAQTELTFDQEKGMQADAYPLSLNSSTTTYQGVDFSTLVSTTSASCFVSSGYKFTAARGYRSSGVVDTNMCQSVKNLKAAGMLVTDVYLFPCPTCSKTAATQVSELVSAMKSCGISSRIWLDIEGSSYWMSSFSSNKAWYQQLVDACGTYNAKNCGIYASASQWSAIFGSTSYVYGNQYPLWYAHYDGVSNFSDYPNYSFGGWTTPYAKQYQGTVTVCSMGVDKNVAIF